MPDVWTALQLRLRQDPGAPIVTSLTIESGDRTELSTASLANAAAKIGNALRDEFDLEPGGRVGLHLPLHWQRACWLAGIWTAGCVAEPHGRDVDLVVADPRSAADLVAGGAEDVAVVSLHPFGLPLPGPLPDGAHDVTVAVRQQPDAYLYAPPDADGPALVLGDRLLGQAALLVEAGELAAAYGLAPHGRLLVDDGTPEDASWLAALAVPLAASGSVVLVDGDGDGIRAQERISAVAR